MLGWLLAVGCVYCSWCGIILYSTCEMSGQDGKNIRERNNSPEKGIVTLSSHRFYMYYA